MNTDTVKQQIADKIRKLMALADPKNGATDAEARNAFEKARAIMVKYGIESIETKSEEDDNVIKDGIKFERKRYGSDRFISNILQKCFGVRVIHGNWFDQKTNKMRYMMHLVGEPADIAMAKEFYEPLRKIFYHGLYRYLRTNGLKYSGEIERSYFHGVYNGLIKANETALAYIYKQQSKEQVDRYAIVLANKDRRVQEAKTRFFPDLRKLKSQKGFHLGHAYDTGCNDGANAALAKKVSQG